MSSTMSNWQARPRPDTHLLRRKPEERPNIVLTICQAIGNMFGDCMRTKKDSDDDLFLRMEGGINNTPPQQATRRGSTARNVGDDGNRSFGRKPRKKVSFSGANEVYLVESVYDKFPPTDEGSEMKREAFWTAEEVQDFHRTWGRHRKNREECVMLSCDCMGCQAEGEAAGFKSFNRIGIRKMFDALSDSL